MMAGQHIDDLVPVILAGGSGTRLWPISRSAFPKHLVELTGERSLLQGTAERLLAAAPAERIVTVAAAGQAILVRRQLETLDPALLDHILLEPSPRNTAAAVALAALDVEARWGGRSLLWVCPSDHVVAAPEALGDALRQGLEAARQGRIVTFGITPTRAETGFGYIARGDSLGHGVFAVESFVEKPKADRARAMVEGGRHYWNSGMFLMRADTLLSELRDFEPELLEATRTARAEAGPGEAIPAEAYGRIAAMPIDKAVMERSERVAVVPCDPAWSDVGSWQALWEIMPKDEAGNVVVGDAVALGAHDNLVKSEHRLVALAGVRDLAVIETGDAVLVAEKGASEAVKALVGILGEAGRREVDVHARELRPWGSFTVLMHEPGVMVREVVLDPGAALTRQRHDHRDEHWTIVEGRARVELGDTVREIEAGGALHVPRGQPHRLGNGSAAGRLRLIEVQLGTALGEADTARLGP